MGVPSSQPTPGLQDSILKHPENVLLFVLRPFGGLCGGDKVSNSLQYYGRGTDFLAARPVLVHRQSIRERAFLAV